MAIGMMSLLPIGMADTASAVTTSGKVTAYTVAPNTYSTTGDAVYGVWVGGIKYTTGNRILGEFLEDVFLRKWTVTLDYTPCYGPPPAYYPCGASLNSATLQSTDVP